MKANCAKAKWAGWVALAAGAIMLAAGLAMGQYAGVYRKAIFIRLERIGIG